MQDENNTPCRVTAAQIAARIKNRWGLFPRIPRLNCRWCEKLRNDDGTPCANCARYESAQPRASSHPSVIPSSDEEMYG